MMAQPLFLILPIDFKKSFAAFHHRERKIPEYRFYETHSGSREACLWVAEHYPEVEIRVYRNLMEFDDDKTPLPFEEMLFDSQEELIDFLKENCYSKEEISSFLQVS